MKKYVFKLLSIILIIATVSTLCACSSTSLTLNKNYNTVGNPTMYHSSRFIDYQGLIAYQDGWYYFLDSLKSLCKVKDDGTERSVIYQEEAISINVIGEWIFYSNPDKEIIKIKTDGTERQALGVKSSKFIVIEDWIYPLDSDDLKKIKNDGTQIKTIANIEDRNYVVAIENDVIYFSGTVNGVEGIFSIKNNGEELLCLFCLDDYKYGDGDAVGFSVNLLNDYPDFVFVKNYHGYYAIRKDGTTTELIDIANALDDFHNDQLWFDSIVPGDKFLWLVGECNLETDVCSKSIIEYNPITYEKIEELKSIEYNGDYEDSAAYTFSKDVRDNLQGMLNDRYVFYKNSKYEIGKYRLFDENFEIVMTIE